MKSESAAPSNSQRYWRRWHFARAVLDERTHELLIDGTDVELERKPLEVLIYLLHHAGEVCTKEELLAAVWPGRFLSETVLTKCIGRLRDTLADDNQDIIKTAYGVGYRLVAEVRVEAVTAPEPVRVDLRPGMHPPDRPHWSLVERLGGGGYGEAWRVRHDKTGEQRVFKFAVEERSLVALKREITLFRLINDTLGDTAKVVRLLDWNLEQSPYFIESEFLAGGSLADWMAMHGGIGAMPLGERLECVAKVADALAAVHSVGVLHKDVKPSNVLVRPLPGNGIDLLLADFGSGSVQDLNRLRDLGITRLGFTRTIAASDATSGTPLYLAPEVAAGQPVTVKSDIYAVGVILYQMIVGDFHRALSPGWERGVDDELLRADVALLVEGSPAERLGDAQMLARRLRTLEERRQMLLAERDEQRRLERSRRLLERAQARQLGLALAFAALVAGLIVSAGLYYRAHQAQLRAEQAVANTRAVSNFLSQDLFGSIDVSKRPVRDLTVKELLDAGAATIDSRFSAQPDIAAELHAALGSSYEALELPPDAQFNRALELYESQQGIGSAPTLQILARLLSIRHPLSELEMLVAHSERALAEGRKRYGESDADVLQLRLKLAFARFHQGQWTQSRDELAALSADMDAFSPGAAHFDGYLSRLLGTVSLYLGDFAQAERWLREARTEVDAISPPPVAARAAVSTNLGALFIETQRYAEAQQQLDAASDGMLRWFPDDSARIMQIRQVQAKLRLEQGNPREAVAILQDLLRQLSSSAHDTDRDGSSLIRYYMGLGLQAQGQLSEASDLLRGALERGELVYGSDYPLTQQIRIAVADCLLLQKKTGDAKAMLTRVEGGGFPGLPVDHPFIGELHRVKGLLRLQEGDRTAAKAEFADALRILAARYGQAHWRAQQVQHELDRLKAGN